MSESEVIPRVVPWYNPDQFHKVYKALYSSDVTSKRWAVDQISVWEMRCYPALPTGIEASAVLARAMIQDILLENTASLCQEQDICMIYSMALIRFVSRIAETPECKKGTFSITAAAKILNIPTWILELRNQATHDYAPSLTLLRAGAEAAMQYLDETFWRLKDLRIQSCVREEEEEELRFFELITSFKEYKYKELREEVECTNELKKTVSQITNYMKDNRRQFIEIFTSPGTFVFTDEELQHILNPGHPFLEDENCCQLPDILEYFWDKILSAMVRNDLIGDLVELLLLTQDQREPLSQKLVIAWVLRIFQAVDFETPRTSILLTYFKSKGVFFDWRRILYACVKHPCRFTPILFAQVLAHLDLKEKWLTQLGHLLAIYQGHGLDKEVNGFEKVFTVQDAKRNKKAQTMRKQRSLRVQGLWSRAPDNIDFANLPIGAILNPVEERKAEEDIPMEDICERYIICGPEETEVEDKSENGKESDSEEEGITTDDDDAEFFSEDNVLADMVYKKDPSNK